jgi:hypothetical protein
MSATHLVLRISLHHFCFESGVQDFVFVPFGKSALLSTCLHEGTLSHFPHFSVISIEESRHVGTSLIRFASIEVGLMLLYRWMRRHSSHQRAFTFLLVRFFDVLVTTRDQVPSCACRVKVRHYESAKPLIASRSQLHEYTISHGPAP